MNSIVPNKLNNVANNNLSSMLASGKAIREINIPNLAQSIVPAVVGETNLFLVSCCIISPQIANELPEIIILTVLGILLDTKMFFCSSVKFNICNGFTSETPINIEKNVVLIK